MCTFACRWGKAILDDDLAISVIAAYLVSDHTFSLSFEMDPLSRWVVRLLYKISKRHDTVCQTWLYLPHPKRL